MRRGRVAITLPGLFLCLNRIADARLCHSTFLAGLGGHGVMSVIVFCGVYAIGNPIDIVIPPEATQDIRDEVIRRLGLDRPLYEQYFIFMTNLLQGDLGRSFVYNIPVLELIGGRLPATLELVLISVISATALGVSLGILRRIPS